MENLWTRRNNSARLSLTTPSSSTNGSAVLDGESPASGRPPPATATTSFFPRRSGTDTPRRVGFGPLTGGLAAPSSGAASTAFGLGQGAFASFGSASKTVKTTGNPFESAGNIGGLGPKTPAATATMTASPDEEATAATPRPGAAIKLTTAAAASKPTASSIAFISDASMSSSNRAGLGSPSDEGAPLAGAAVSPPSHPLRDSWCFWFRPPLAKGLGYLDYEKTLHGIATVRTVEDFFTVYGHLKRPSALPTVSDYYLFKEGIRPIWEDDENRKGGRWVVRMKKGVADRYWEDLQLALIGDQFADEGEDVCGAVLSIRNGEDTLSIWTRVDGGRVLKIRETMKHILGFPPNTRLEFKSHDSSIQQRTAVEERREKGGGNNNNSNTNSNSTNTQNNSTTNNNNNINNHQADNRRHSLISVLLPSSSGRGFDDPRPETAAAGA